MLHSPPKSKNMEDLPDPVMVDILSRLPVKTIILCKHVCKKWRGLVSDSYFANLHLSRSPAGLMIHHRSEKEEHKPGILKWVEVEDELNHHTFYHDPVMNLDLNLAPIFQKSHILMAGAVNGFICLWQSDYQMDNTCICNPITREYMILSKQQYSRQALEMISHCFGVDSMTQEYKVIRIFELPSEAEVYTLGTGRWRSLGHVPYRLHGPYGPFFKGHAHWIVSDEDSPERICAFDFDKETFELFPSPPNETIREREIVYQSLGVLKGCLCLCDTYDMKFEIWVMREYGIKNSWHKEVLIEDSISPEFGLLSMLMGEAVDVTEGLKDGTILMVAGDDQPVAYCLRTKTITILDMQIFDRYLDGLTYRPSFLKLQNFENETVHVL